MDKIDDSVDVILAAIFLFEFQYLMDLYHFEKRQEWTQPWKMQQRWTLPCQTFGAKILRGPTSADLYFHFYISDLNFDLRN